MKKAILTLHCGTGYPGETEKCIDPIRRAFKNAFQAWECFNVHIGVGRMHISGEGNREGIFCTEMMERLKKDGYERMCISPLLLVPGIYYEGIRKIAPQCPISGPLLENEDDFVCIADIYGKIARDADRDVLLMGHGSQGAGDEIYARLAERLGAHVHLACARGGLTLENTLPRIESKRLLLMPLMLTAGSHARREMSGDGPGSWKSILINRGFDVRVRLEGMGSMSEVQAMFVRKVRRALED